MIAAIFFALGVLSMLSTCLALFTPRRPLIVGWLAWVVGLVPCEVPRAALVMNAVLLGASVVLVPLDAALGIAAIALFAAAMVGDLVLARRSRRSRVRRSDARCRPRWATTSSTKSIPISRPCVAARSRFLREGLAPFRGTSARRRHVADVAVRRRRRTKPSRSLLHAVAAATLPGADLRPWRRVDPRQEGSAGPADRVPLRDPTAGSACSRTTGCAPTRPFPDQIVDIKRAIAWVHEHAHEHGGDPQQIFLAGGSAGGHLSALAALTMNDPTLQPGFEDADTSVVAAMPLYGDYDWLDSHGERPNVASTGRSTSRTRS